MRYNSSTVKTSTERKIIKLCEYSDDIGISSVLVGGCFDILHIGHIRFLQEAKKLGDILIVALESDGFILRRKKRKPFHTVNERAEMLAALWCVDRVIVLPELKTDTNYNNMVKKIRPNIIAVSPGDPVKDKKEKQAHSIGARLVEIQVFEKGKSTTYLAKFLSRF